MELSPQVLSKGVIFRRSYICTSPIRNKRMSEQYCPNWQRRGGICQEKTSNGRHHATELVKYFYFVWVMVEGIDAEDIVKRCIGPRQALRIPKPDARTGSQAFLCDPYHFRCYVESSHPDQGIRELPSSLGIRHWRNLFHRCRRPRLQRRIASSIAPRITR